MNKNKKWYSLFLVLLISMTSVIQPIQAVAAVANLETASSETVQSETVNADHLNTSETASSEAVQEEPKQTEESTAPSSEEAVAETTPSEEVVKEEASTSSSSEKTVDSSTEEKKETKRAKRSVDREPIDIKSIMNTGESFISDVGFKVTKDNQEIDYTKEAIPSDAMISLAYKFKIPDRLLKDKLLKAGDYYEIALPEGIKVSNVSGPLNNSAGVHFGDYIIQDGKVKIIFNDKVETLHNISGSVDYSERLEETIQAGKNTIKIPVEDGIKNVDVVVKPNGGTAIAKAVRKAEDNKTINWDVSINTDLSTLNNAVVSDPMPEGLELKKVTIWEQQVNLKGEVISVSEAPLVEGPDYTRNGNDITFKGTSNKSYKITYESVVKEESIPAEGGDLNFHNKATLKNNGNEVSAEAETSVSYGKLIEKSGPTKDTTKDGHVYKWRVSYNGGNKDLPPGSYITDELTGSNQKYVEDKKTIKVSSGTREYKQDTDFVITYGTDNTMKISFPNGLKEKVDIDYCTEVPFVVDGNVPDYSLGNTVTTDSGIKAEAGGSIERYGMKKNADVDYSKKKITWSVEINNYKYPMKNWSMKDTMSKGLVLDKSTFNIIDQDTGTTLVLGKDYTLSVPETKDSFEVAFIGELANSTSNRYKVEYVTDFSTYQEENENRHNLFKNTADASWEDKSGKSYSDSVTKEVPVDVRYIDNASKSGEYNGTNKHITWTIFGNFNQETLKNATIVDPIKDGQDYVDGSAKVYEAILDKNGNPTKGPEETGAVSFADNTVTAKLPEGSTKAYMLVFETTLEGKVISDKPIYNTATYTNDGRSKEVSSSVKPYYGGYLATKSGEQDPNNRNYANWSVMINPSQSTLKNVEVVDEPSNNQLIDESSIVIYGTKVESNEYIGKDENNILELGKDYTVDLATDNITGKQILTIRFLNEIHTAYKLEYRTRIQSTKVEDTLSNKLSVKGENEEVVSFETSSSTKVIVSGGSASGTAAAVKLVKTDENTQKPLAAAQFELWTSEGKPDGQLIRSGETDINGELRFGNLRPNEKYLLYETKAPAGFSVSQELRNGVELQLEETGDINLFETKELTNDMPRIHFNKIDGNDGHALAGAQFMVKNEQGEFYNGIDSKYRATWVDSQDKVSDDVKKSLTSDANGQVEVEGLNVGTYSIQEIVAPEGYDKATKDIPFEVIDDEGLIRLKDDVTISNMPYEKTEVTINKTWDDANNQDGKRPKTISFDLFANGTKVDTLEMTDDKQAPGNVWKATFSDLRKYDDNMKEITYSIKENEVDKYSVSDKEVIVKDKKAQVTNSYKPEEVSVLAKKHWDDKDNQDGKRPGYIVVHVMAKVEGEEKPTSVNHIRVDHGSNWQYEFNHLPKYRDGKEIIYTVEEEKVDGYDVSIAEMDSKDKPKDIDFAFDITNKHEVAKRDISVKKVWNDANNQDGKRLDSIDVQLYADDKEVGKPVPLNSENNWSTTWKQLDTNKAIGEEGRGGSKEIVYTVKEVTEVPGYDKAEITGDMTKGFIVTNNHKPSTIVVKGTKVWEDANNQDGIRPDEIEVQLLSDEKEKGKLEEVEGKVTVAKKETDWAYEFKDLPEFKANEEGRKITYGVKELPVDGYTSQVEGTTITNTHKPDVTTVSGTKVWEDANNQDGKRPDEIEVQLLSDVKEAGKFEAVEGQIAKASKETGWVYEFKDLPKFKEDAVGRKIAYDVKELPVDGYTSKKDGTKFTNSHTPTTVDVEGTKVWNDANNQDGKRPESITVNLLADGKKIDSKEVTGSRESSKEAATWSYEFKDLPEFKEDAVGQKINYTVQEESVTDYSSEVKDFKITNSYTPKKTSVNVVKAWEDNNNQDKSRPESIKVKLLADEKETGDELTLTAKNNWQGAFTNLDVYEKGNVKKEIKYTVKEVTVGNDYTSQVTGSAKEGFVVTNTRPLETVDISGKKIWEDDNNQDGKRPETITVNLLADGEKVASKDVKGSRGFEDANAAWSYEFKDLPKHVKGEEGKEIKYTVTEEKVKNYTTNIDGFNITNTYEPQETRLFVEKVWNDSNDQDGKRPKDIAVQLYANGKEVVGQKIKLSEKTNWKASFDKLDAYVKGKEIKYTVKEISEAAKKYGYTAVLDYQANKENKNNTDVKVTNSRPVETTDISGTKVWKDANNQDGKRPETITVNLFADGEKVDSQVVKGDKQAETWSYTFTGLNKNRTIKEGEDSEAIVYTVEEEAVGNGYTSKVEGTTITNTREIETVNLSGIKTWDDANNQDGIRPETITVNLLSDEKEKGKLEVIDSEEVSATKDWKYDFKGLPKYLAGEVGREITYDLEEVAVEGYTSKKEGTNFTNTHAPELINIPVKKVWEDTDNQDGKRPGSIEISLFGTDKEKAIETKSVSGDMTSNEWTTAFENKPKFEAGQEIDYTIKEKATGDSYESAITGDKETGFVVTNTHELEKVTISGTKTWDDANNQDGIRPKTIKVNLLSDEKEKGKLEVIDSEKVSATKDWKYDFKGLPKYATGEVGREITYDVEEVAVKGYTSTKDGTNFTNIHAPELINIPVTKIWKDNNNKVAKRPESITVKLLANNKPAKDKDGKEITGEVKGSMTADKWEYTFKKLPKYANGKEINYSVEEVAVDQYETAIDKFTITNTFVQQPVKETPKKSSNENGPTNSSKNTSSHLPKTGEKETAVLMNLGVMMLITLVMTNVWTVQRRKSKED